VRSDDAAAGDAAAAVNDLKAMRELTAERTVVALLQGTCNTPLGAHAQVDGDRLSIDAFVGLPDGSEWIRDRHEGRAEEPALAAAELTQRLLGAGAREILDRAEAES
jgi:hydroxymethylbilane synthase